MARILLMEDDLDQGEMLAELLNGAGHIVFHFMDGHSSLEFLGRNKVDIILTDVLVKQDGHHIADGGIKLISTLRQIRRVKPNQLPIVAMSGGLAIPGGTSPLQLARDVGADALFEKPVPIDELLLTINELLADVQRHRSQAPRPDSRPVF